MDIGQFRERIIVQTVTTVTNQNTGEQDLTWTDSKTIWAKKEMSAGDEKATGGIVSSINRTDFIVRFGHEIDNTFDFRIKYGGRIYDIESIEEVTFRTFTKLRCKEHSNQ